MKNKFSDWYAGVFDAQLRDGTDPHVDTRISALKPLHAKWLTETLGDLKQQTDLIVSCWHQAQIFVQVAP